MNSPPDPGSPSPSTPSSGSPPPEEATQPSNPSGFLNIARDLTQSFAGGASKRRLPGGPSFGASSSNRDPKSRRRGDSARNAGTGGANTAAWDAKGESKREERELVDTHIVEYLRKGKFVELEAPI